MDPFLGEIRPVPYNFAPLGWALCEGQILSIAQNTALFALLGTTYGGNGQTTFALPDLRGRCAMSSGTGPGLSTRDLGEVGGEMAVTLLSTEMPNHSHNVAVASSSTSRSPSGTAPATSHAKIYGPATGHTMNTDTLNLAGGSQPHNNLQPFTVINYIIALEGVFPQRN